MAGLSEFVTVECKVTVTIPRADLWPWDGTVTNENYAAAIEANPSGNLIDFAQYDSCAASEITVKDAK